MMKNMKLATKISVGFGLLIVIAMALGGMAVYNMNNVSKHTLTMKEEYVAEVAILSQLERRSLRFMLNVRGYTMSGQESYLKVALKDLALIKTSLAEAKQLAGQFTELVTLRANVGKCMEALASYEALTKKTIGAQEKMAGLRDQMDQAAGNYMRNCIEYLSGQNRKMEAAIASNAGQEQLRDRVFKLTTVEAVISMCNELRVKNFKAQATWNPELLDSAIKDFPLMEKKIAGLGKKSKDPVDPKRVKNIVAAASAYKAATASFLTTWKETRALDEERGKVGNDLLSLVRETTYAGINGLKRLAESNVNELNMSSTIMLVGLAVALVVGILLAFFITISITRPISRVIAGLSEGSAQVTAASTQVSSSSQSLAEGAAQQAASLEETSASMEEISSMTQKNAENSQQADHLMTNSREVVGQANSSMKELKAAMDRITSASEETSKIIKTIDEIAFQTNLLALNAAVEAARAGEAGAGFAVVADEVRNLAMRAAEAAKNTAELIEENIKNIGQGSTLVLQTDEAFDQVIESSDKIAELVSEIAAASQEQTQGITQVNQAMTEMDKVTQQNAAGAEESAAASEELSAQAMTLDGFVSDLDCLVGGSSTGQKRAASSDLRTSAKAQKHTRALPAPVAKPAKHNDPKPEIPFEDDDFKDF